MSKSGYLSAADSKMEKSEIMGGGSKPEARVGPKGLQRRGVT